MEKPRIELPKFIVNSIKSHNTSLGEHPSLPNGDETHFLEKLLMKRYEELIKKVAKINDLQSNKKEYLIEKLSSDINQCKKIEQSLKNDLEKICFDYVVDLFGLDENTLEFECVLKYKIKPEIQPNLEPMPLLDCYFESVDEIESLEKEVYKRRLINSLVQGATVRKSSNYNTIINKIYELNPKLPELYYNITTLNDYLCFVKEVVPTNDNLAGFVSVDLSNETPKIKSEGIIFPVLLFETIKGVYELLSAHGLPKSKQQAEYIIGKADFLLAENWDRRLGVGLWDLFDNLVEDKNIEPEVFVELISLNVSDFNQKIKEIFANTKKGVQVISDIENNVLKNKQFENIESIIKKDAKLEYFTPEELISEYNIEESVTTSSVGDYTYDVPAFGDKESLSRKDMIKNGQAKWNINENQKPKN